MSIKSETVPSEAQSFVTKKIKTPEFVGWYPDDIQRATYFFEDREQDCGYGYTTKALLMKDEDQGTLYDPHELKGIFRNGKLISRGLVSRQYAVIPDQAIEQIFVPLVENRFKIKDKYHTTNGTRTFWELEPIDESFKNRSVKYDGKSDFFDIRLVIRNSVNGGMSAGVELDTFRQICSNGMVGWGKEFSTRSFHYGKQNTILRTIGKNINATIEQSDILMGYLDKATQIEANIETMQAYVDISGLSKNWLPDFVRIDEEKYKVLRVRGEKHTLYDAMNESTYKLTRSDPKHPEHNKVEGSLGYGMRREFERGVSRAMVQIVKSKIKA